MAAQFVSQQMDDHIAIIEDCPAGLLFGYTVKMKRADTLLHLKFGQDFILNRTGLAIIVDRCNHEIVGQCRLFSNV